MENELKPCPFCGGEATFVTDRIKTSKSGEVMSIGIVMCKYLCCGQHYPEDRQTAIEAWNRRAPAIVNVETCFYDKEEIHENCTVQVLTNTKTGDVSVGWWENE